MNTPSNRLAKRSDLHRIGVDEVMRLPSILCGSQVIYACIWSSTSVP
jgi:hypothetical protein